MPRTGRHLLPDGEVSSTDDSSGGGSRAVRARRIDICNGDADGLCAAIQWRFHTTPPAVLCTGLKREIELLGRIHASSGDEVCVFDLSMARNRAALDALLERGVRVRYFDHHAAGVLPSHPGLEAHIDGASDACTSLIVDDAIGGSFRAWALVGAYGDNLALVADRLADASGLGSDAKADLRRLGETINYNAYGQEERDVCIAPARLYAVMAGYRDPRSMIAAESIVAELVARRADDLARARAWPAWREAATARMFVLPDAAWSRRVVGTLANVLANEDRQRAQAVLAPRNGGGYVVSVRAPVAAPRGADAFCRGFGGEGRARAAGLDRLAEGDLDRFEGVFLALRWGEDSDRLNRPPF